MKKRNIAPLKRAAQFYNLPPSTVRAAVRRGELHVIRIGAPGSRRAAAYVELDEIDRWLSARTELATN